MDLRSNLSKARGLGSAKEGSNEWLKERITAVGLIPLTVWFVVQVVQATSSSGIDGVIYLLSSPFNAILMIIFLGASIHHGTQGMKVVVEDYVHCPCASMFLNITMKFIAIVSIVAVTFTIFYANLSSYNNNLKKPNTHFCHKANIGGEAAAPAAADTQPEPVINVEAPKE